MSKYLIMSEENITSLTLAHHGIKGQKWGIRRFQNEDGSLTSEGKKRYGTNSDNINKNTSEDLLKEFHKNFIWDDTDYIKQMDDGRYIEMDAEEYDPKTRKFKPIEPTEIQMKAANDYIKNYKQHNDIAKKAIKDDFIRYKNLYGIDDKKVNEAIKNLSPSYTTINKDGDGIISYKDDTVTNHWFDVEYNFLKKRASYVSMNG